jgi:superfamily II DNA or RNA helicase
VVTAKRVLDEGVNVPEVATAYIVASTTVARQWIQRRGRVLRKCDAIGKTKATIHDFLVVPPSREAGDEDIRSLLRGEFDRIGEFGRLSLNSAAPDGALSVVHPYLIEYFG